MKAIRCHAYGPPRDLVYEDVPPIEPQRGHVVIDVKAAGVNFPDLLIVKGEYQFKPPPPFSPGGEVAGVIKAVGEGVSRFSPEDRVVGLAPWGGFAEEVAVPQHMVLPAPEAMDFETASAFTLTYATSLYALEDRAALQPDETLLVLGAAGGVGLAAVQIGKAMGARVIAAASTPDKLEACAQAGADELINYETDDLKGRVKALSRGGGADVVFDPVGGRFAEPALRATAWGGRFLVIGFAAGEIPRIPLNLPLLKGCQIVGVFWGSFAAREPARIAAHMATLTAWARNGVIAPHISKTYPLSEAASALEDLAARRVIGKVVLIP